VEHRVEFLGWRRREDLMRTMRQDADLFLFPSLHDEAGWAVAEALGCGLPVVCLDRGGPPIVAAWAGRAVPSSGGPNGVAAALAGRLADAAAVGSDVARARARDWGIDPRTAALKDLLSRALSPTKTGRGGVSAGAGAGAWVWLGAVDGIAPDRRQGGE
jgi:glycosyltransferase involved in cell wall biosynthesis